MTRDKLFHIESIREDFNFNEQVAEVFDDMLNRSVPFYGAVIEAIAGLVGNCAPRGATIYDLGCSTGGTLLELGRRLVKLEPTLIGIDNSDAMLEKARRKVGMFSKSEMITFQRADILTHDFSGADVIICNYILQFLRPMIRPDFVRKLYNSMPAGGILILSEKTISHDRRLNREFIAMHHQYKRDRGYSELEIASKREALENVLIPFSKDENGELLKQAGFSTIETFFQWFNFCSFVAIK
ncbi:MAG: carboxy-S-adenosyl-L-methionine synthase CmoA [Desulfobulbaceae bacterium]|nr:carboxy-S-adenosyl-L-methionine synthase CmoA [Desulfobulbaceae bacterium]